MTAEQLELLRAVAQWFYDNAPTAVLPGRKDTAMNDITRVIIRDDAQNKYRCPHCGEVVVRKSERAWIKSYCDKTGKTVHMQKVKNDEQHDKNNKSDNLRN